MSNESAASPSPLEAFSQSLAAIVGRTADSVVAVHARQRAASSGLLWRPGVVVTAAHTLTREEDLTVTMPDGRSAPATLGGRDDGTDLAVLTLDDEADRPQRSDAGTVSFGELAITVGRANDGSPTAHLGLVAGLGGPWRTWRGGRVEQRIRLGVPLHPGFSGSAVVNAAGRVIGIATAGLSRGFGLAIPTATIDRVATELVERGRVARGFLGVGMQSVQIPQNLRGRLGLDSETGVIVIGVEQGGPAEQAGALIGDVVVALDGAAVADTDDVQAALSGDRVGRPLRMTVVRGGEITELAATIGEWPGGRGR